MPKLEPYCCLEVTLGQPEAGPENVLWQAAAGIKRACPNLGMNERPVKHLSFTKWPTLHDAHSKHHYILVIRTKNNLIVGHRDRVPGRRPASGMEFGIIVCDLSETGRLLVHAIPFGDPEINRVTKTWVDKKFNQLAEWRASA